MSNIDDTKAVTSEGPLLLGIDAGSTTIKLVVFDGHGKLVYSSYDKHSLDIKQTVVAALHHMRYMLGDFEASVAITGSAGILLSEILGLPYIQEVVATKKAVEEFYPQADVVIELGGEDAKIIYLTGGVEQRMNSSCAGGTGGFLDLLSGTIGVRRGNFTNKAFGSATHYPIASRCAVFAQTDVRALLNQGATKSDIIDSVYRAIVTQTISGLACGRPIKGTVVFLGGPFRYSKGLATRYQEMLGLSRQEAIVPDEPHTFVARGAALYSKGKDPYLLSELERMISEAAMDFDESVEYLTPLLPEGMTADRFRQEHPKCVARKMSRSIIPKDVFLGIDAGSTTVKMVLIDTNGDIVTSRYERHRGEFIELTRKMLLDIYTHIPDGRLGEWYRSNLARVVVTGYGEHALKVALRADDGIVETAAHLRASQELVGEVDSILDIGGQDIKYMRLVDGAIDDIVINEACSSGCGALIESFTKQFKSSRWQFADDGLEARHPVDLGTRCTVFMTSRVRHAQKEGVLRGDISAGLAYSVVRNALYKVIGFSNLDAMGDRIMVQGGTFMSDAVLAAFENITGKQAIRPDIAKSMGAYGAALTARDQYLAGAKQTEFLSCDEVGKLEFVQSHKHCGLCENNCMLTICKFNSKDSDEKPRTFITGNRCERLSRGGVSSNNLPNTFKLEQELLASYRDKRGIEGRLNVGLTCARELFETLPFWTTFVEKLGCNPLVSDFSSTDQFRKGIAAIPAEGACYPSKLIFGQIAETIERGADVVFLPQIDAGFIYGHRAGRSCPVASHYADVVAVNPVSEETPLITSDLIGLSLGADEVEIAERLFKALESRIEGITYETVREALKEALTEQYAFVDRLRDAADEAFEQMEDEGIEGVVLACHSYHVDPGLSHGIDTLLNTLGFAVFSPLSLSHRIAERPLPDACANEWYQPAQLYDICQYVAENDKLELVHLYSFGCGVDPLAIETARRLLRSKGKLYTGLKLDEMVNLATIRIRLRSLRAALDKRRTDTFTVPDLTPRPTLEVSDSKHFIVPGMAPEHMAYVAEELREFGYRIDLLPQTDASSADTGLRFADNDLCYSTVSLVGNVIRHLGGIEEANGARILVPQPCTECRGVENEIVLRDGLDKTKLAKLSIVGFPGIYEQLHVSDDEMHAIEHALGRADDALRTRIDARATEIGAAPDVAIIGNFNLLFTPELNNHVFDLLLEEGVHPVFPHSSEVLATNAPLLELAGGFYERGVRDIIFLQTFGCLTSNVYGRGVGKLLKKNYPDLNITYIDYDSGVSETNQINRIKLALSIAKERAGARPPR